MSAKLRNHLSRWTAGPAVHTYPIDVVRADAPRIDTQTVVVRGSKPVIPRPVPGTSRHP